MNLLSQLILTGMLLVCLCSARVPEQKSPTFEELEQIVLENRKTDIVKFKKSIHQLSELSDKKKNEYYKCIALRELGFYHIIKSQYDSSLVFLKQSLELAEKINDRYLAFETNIFLGLVYLETLDYYSALIVYEKQIIEAKEIGKHEHMLGGYQMIGDIYRRCKVYDKSYENFLKGSPIHSKIDTAVERHGWWNLNFGDLYFFQDDYESALKHYEAALKIWKEINMIRAMGYTYNSLGRLYMKLNDDKAVESFQLAIENNKKMKNSSQIMVGMEGLGNCHLRFDKNKEKAAQFFKKVIDIGRENNLEELAVTSIDFFIENREYSKQLPFSFEQLLKLKIIATEKSLEKTSKVNLKIVEATEKIHLAEEKALSARQKNNFQQNFIFALLGFLTIIAFFSITIFLKNKKLSSYSIQTEEQLNLIQEQSIVLNEVNNQLQVNNLSLENDFNLQNLKLTHFKHIFENIESASGEGKSSKLDSIMRMKLDDEYWDELKYIQSFRDKEFLSNLTQRFPKLTPKNISLCCMLRLGISTKEIAQITYSSTAAVKMAKSRLRKKLNLEKGDKIVSFLNMI